MNNEIYTAIDANINRAMEGIRVCEDVFRFIARNSRISLSLKEIRHNIMAVVKALNNGMLLQRRDVDRDSQKYIDLESEKARESLTDIVKSNIHRTMEAMRSLEEFFKLLNKDSNENPFQKIRFSVYSLEKEMIFFLLRRDKQKRFKSSLYTILDSSFVEDKAYSETAERLIKGGASVIQLRMKDHAMREIMDAAKKVSSVCMDNDVLFIVNDYPEIAILSGADGVHLGQNDLSVQEVRSLLPVNMLIGISTNSQEQARLAAEDEPDYIAVGPVFDTKTKYGELMRGIGVDIVKKVVEATDLPVVSIGGITPEGVDLLKETGCSSYAVVSYLYKDGNIELNCKKIIDHI